MWKVVHSLRQQADGREWAEVGWEIRRTDGCCTIPSPERLRPSVTMF